jgi:hypothetical protein
MKTTIPACHCAQNHPIPPLLSFCVEQSTSTQSLHFVIVRRAKRKRPMPPLCHSAWSKAQAQNPSKPFSTFAVVVVMSCLVFYSFIDNERFRKILKITNRPLITGDFNKKISVKIVHW